MGKGTGSRYRWDEPPHRCLVGLVAVDGYRGADGAEPRSPSPEPPIPERPHPQLLARKRAGRDRRNRRRHRGLSQARKSRGLAVVPLWCRRQHEHLHLPICHLRSARATRLAPAGEASAWIGAWILPIIIGLQISYLLLFPTGRLPSKRWRWLAWLTGAFVLAGVISSAFAVRANSGLGPIRNPFGIGGFTNIYDAVLTPLPLLYAAVAYSLFVRLRHAGGVERQQIKWFAYAAVATVSGIILAYMI